MKGSVVITASSSPMEKSTDLAGESKLNANSCVPFCTLHSLAVVSALPVISLLESPSKTHNTRQAHAKQIHQNQQGERKITTTSKTRSDARRRGWGPRRLTGDVAAPDGAVVAAVGAEALAVVGEPDGGGVVLGAGEEEVALPVVLEERQRPLVAFHQDRPHGRTIESANASFSRRWAEELRNHRRLVSPQLPVRALSEEKP